MGAAPGIERRALSEWADRQTDGGRSDREYRNGNGFPHLSITEQRGAAAGNKEEQSAQLSGKEKEGGSALLVKVELRQKSLG